MQPVNHVMFQYSISLPYDYIYGTEKQLFLADVLINQVYRNTIKTSMASKLPLGRTLDLPTIYGQY